MAVQAASPAVLSRTPAPARRGGVAVLLLAASAPVVLVVGVLLAQAVQRVGGYDPVRQTVSTLAGRGADERWVMTTTLFLLGVIFLGLAVLLRAPRPGRVVLGVGALAVLVTALAPQPAAGSSAIHMTAMVVGCVAVTLWPLGLLRDPRLRAGAFVATATMAAALAWLCAQAWTDGTWLGVAERAVLLVQTLWPVAVALDDRRVGTRAGWTVVLAVGPPVVFAVGLVAAQAAQPTADALSMSLSALAALGATDRWIMTTTVITGGLLYVAVAAGLRVPTPGRVLLGAGGALLVVATLFPQPADGGTSWVHMVAGALAWAGFALWPLAVACSPSWPAGWRWSSAAVTVVLAALLVWFAVQLATSGTWYGRSERILFVAMSVWPVVLAVRSATADALRTRAARSPRGS